MLTQLLDECAAAAEVYAAGNLPVFPVHSIRDGACTCGRECGSPGKHPLTRNGVKDATTDRETIRQWWAEWPFANVALATGGNVYVVDLDGEQGMLEWARVCHRHRATAIHTRVSITGGGGRHLFYQPPDPELRNTHWRIGEGIDTRGAGGYVLLPPSLHKSGRRYEWPEGNPGMVSMPGWLVELIKPRMATPTQPPRIRFGETTHYGWGVVRNACARISRAPEGNRNDTLNAQAFLVGQFIGGGEIDPRGIAEQLMAAHPRPCDEAKVAATVRRALHDGTQYPRMKETDE